MSTASSSVHMPNPYTGSIVVKFEEDLGTGKLESVTIKTDHLTMRPANAKDIEACDAIFGDEESMKLYLGGKRSHERTMQRLEMYATRWLGKGKYGGVPYPYSGFAVICEDKVIGSIVLRNGNCKGEAQIGGAGNRHFFNKSYGKEAATAIVQGYAPELFKRGYQVNLHETDKSGKSIEGNIVCITATASPKNTYSVNILEDVGFNREGYDAGSDRYHYRINIADIINKV